MQKGLAHPDAFKQVLADYHISQQGKRILAVTKLALFVGPSGSGRNTIINALVKTDKYYYIVSDTTRERRVNNGVPEKDGVEYWFRSEEEMLKDLKAGRFLEAAVIHGQQVSGISLRELSKASEANKIAINEVEVVGATKVLAAKPDTFVFFVAPPSFEVWMQRLEGRGKMSPSEKRRRMESAVDEFTSALQEEHYIYIVNDTFEHAVEKVHQVVLAGEHDPITQTHGRDVIEKLLIETRAHLKTA